MSQNLNISGDYLRNTYAPEYEKRKGDFTEFLAKITTMNQQLLAEQDSAGLKALDEKWSGEQRPKLQNDLDVIMDDFIKMVNDIATFYEEADTNVSNTIKNL